MTLSIIWALTTDTFSTAYGHSAHKGLICSKKKKKTHFDGEAEDFNTHTAHVWGGHLSHQLGKLVSVLVDLLHCKSTWGNDKRSSISARSGTLNSVTLIFYL